MTLPILLLIAFYFLLVAEFFLPTGGLMGVASAAAIISGIVIAFSHSMFFGIAMLATALVSTPILLTGLVRVWPHTPIGRRMLNRRPGQTDDGGPPKRTRDGHLLSELVGCRGIAKSDLLPSGLVLIENEKLDAVSTGMPIDAGSQIVVTSVEAGRVRVRAVTDAEARNDQDLTVRSPAALEQTFESLEDL